MATRLRAAKKSTAGTGPQGNRSPMGTISPARPASGSPQDMRGMANATSATPSSVPSVGARRRSACHGPVGQSGPERHTELATRRPQPGVAGVPHLAVTTRAGRGAWATKGSTSRSSGVTPPSTDGEAGTRRTTSMSVTAGRSRRGGKVGAPQGGDASGPRLPSRRRRPTTPTTLTAQLGTRCTSPPSPSTSTIGAT